LFDLRGRDFWHLCVALTTESRPDWIIGFSDTYFGIAAQFLAERYGVRSLIDAYDNYEGYMPWMKPLHLLWRRALSKATAVSAAGPALLDLMAGDRSNVRRLLLPMAVEPVGFDSIDRAACRREFGLPESAKLVGYCGSVFPNRGIEVLFDAMRHLSLKRPDTRLVLCGRRHRSVPLPEGTHWLGQLAQERIPKLLNAFDVVVVVNRLTAFGSFSYPTKLYEAMSCSLPVVATSTPATRWILRDHPEMLVKAGDDAELARSIENSLNVDRVDYGRLKSWDEIGDDLEGFLTSTH
jgi:glycosyltransferase involved in cell wall biosynthesis